VWASEVPDYEKICRSQPESCECDARWTPVFAEAWIVRETANFENRNGQRCWYLNHQTQSSCATYGGQETITSLIGGDISREGEASLEVILGNLSETASRLHGEKTV
jgi:hypothetical protein